MSPRSRRAGREHNQSGPPISLRFVENPKLDAAALVHARDMAEHDEMTHEGTDGTTPAKRIAREKYTYQTAAENVAKGQKSIAQVMRSWMESPPHKKNILGDYTEIGAACVKGEDGSRFWCVNFGRPWPILDPSTASAAVVAGFNAARKKAGKSRLAVNPTLHQVALLHARAMAAQDAFNLEKEGGLSPFERIEKSGYRFTAPSGRPLRQDSRPPRRSFRAWLKGSYQSRQTSSVTSAEVGIELRNRRGRTPYWCAIFGKPAH